MSGGHAHHLVVVNSEEYMARFVEAFLAFELDEPSLRVTWAGDLASAHAAVRDPTVDVVLLEWGPSLSVSDLPGADHGEARVRAIAEAAGSTPVVVLTTWAPEGARERALEAGAADLVTMPFSPTELGETVARHLGGGRPSDDGRDLSTDRLP